jgi:hypothetical protein
MRPAASNGDARHQPQKPCTTKPACRCATDPDQRHGPYIQWSRTVKGRTVKKLLTAEQLETYQPWIDNGRRLRELAHELETLSLDAMCTAEGWNR